MCVVSNALNTQIISNMDDISILQVGIVQGAMSELRKRGSCLINQVAIFGCPSKLSMLSVICHNMKKFVVINKVEGAFSIILGCLAHVLVVPGKQTTKILNTGREPGPSKSLP